jgi:oxygen-independent coproporphyrinogen-3 oxidase
MLLYSVYLHIPFCRHRCAYCDFNTYAGLESSIPVYTRALCREIELASQAAGEKLPVHSLFFGGGTPSLLPAEELVRIVRSLEQAFSVQGNAEFTLEANPGTLTPAYLQELRALGVNRLSLGVQSASPEELRLLERQHSPQDVLQAVRWARQAGFDNLNLDLIFGLPFQSLAAWEHSLDLALVLHPEHLSLYALTLEHGTPMEKWVQRGLLPEPDPDLAAEMYELASIRLEEAGYTQYEISNWARRKEDGALLACRHNLQYWRNRPYLGFGAGAHGFADGVRTANVLAPAAYIQRCLNGALQPFPRTPATLEATRVDRDSEIAETMIMGLRLVREGVSRRGFYARFGEDLAIKFDREIRDLVGKGVLEWGEEDQDVLRLTSKGRLLGNQAFVAFV